MSAEDQTSKKPFFILLCIVLSSVSVSEMVAFSLGIVVYQESNSAAIFTVLISLTYFPRFIFSPLFARIIKKENKKSLLRLIFCAKPLCATVFLILLKADLLGIQIMFAILFMTSILNGMEIQVVRSLAPIMVPKNFFSKSVFIITAGEIFAKVISPLASGIILLKFDLAIVFVIALVIRLTILAISTFYSIVPDVFAKPQKEDDKGGIGIIGTLKKSFIYIKESRALYNLGLFIVFFYFNYAIFISLAVPLLMDVHDNMSQVSFIMSAGEFGALFFTIALVFIVIKKSSDAILFTNLLAGLLLFVMVFMPPSIMLIATVLIVTNIAFVLTWNFEMLSWSLNVPKIKLADILVVRNIALTVFPVSCLIAGPLIDYAITPFVLKHEDFFLMDMIQYNKKSIPFLYLISGFLLVANSFFGLRNKPFRSLL